MRAVGSFKSFLRIVTLSTWQVSKSTFSKVSSTSRKRLSMSPMPSSICLYCQPKSDDSEDDARVLPPEILTVWGKMEDVVGFIKIL